MKLLKINGYYVLIDENLKLEKNDVFLEKEQHIGIFPNYLTDISECHKIIAMEQPLIDNLKNRCSLVRCKFGSIMTNNHPCKKNCQLPVTNLNIKTLYVSHVDRYNKLRSIGLTSDQCEEVLEFFDSLSKNKYNDDDIKKIIEISQTTNENMEYPSEDEILNEFNSYKKKLIIDENTNEFITITIN